MVADRFQVTDINEQRLWLASTLRWQGAALAMIRNEVNYTTFLGLVGVARSDECPIHEHIGVGLGPLVKLHLVCFIHCVCINCLKRTYNIFVKLNEGPQSVPEKQQQYLGSSYDIHFIFIHYMTIK